MTTQLHRLTLIGCALAWLLVGMHWPIVHHVLEHGSRPPAWLLAIVVAIAAAAVASLLKLLRDAGRGSA